MANWREPHWSEGMLLLPQHLQTSHRYFEAVIGAAWQTSSPFAWGFDELKLSDAQIREGMVAIESCRLRTPLGTWLVVPENAEVPPRSVREALAKSPDGLTVYLAVPRLHEVRPNASYQPSTDGSPTRFRIEALEVRDENSGDNLQQIEVHAFSGRLLLGDESRLPGIEAVPLVRVHLSGEAGGAPRRDARFMPPLMRLGAWPDLLRIVADVVHDAGARSRELAADAARSEMSFRTGVPEHIERLLMLHALNESVAVLRQTVALSDLRPWQAYLELCRLAGRLSVFNADPGINPDRAVREYPAYDHNAIGPNFTLLCDHIRALLKALGVGTFEWRAFEPRPHQEGLQVALNEEWLDGRREMFIGVHCGSLDESQLDLTLKGIDWKIASADEVDQIFNGGDYGLELKPVRGVGGLPISPEIKYYKVHRDVVRWPKVEAGRVLAIRYSSGAQARLVEHDIRFRVYVLMRSP